MSEIRYLPVGCADTGPGAEDVQVSLTGSDAGKVDILYSCLALGLGKDLGIEGLVRNQQVKILQSVGAAVDAVPYPDTFEILYAPQVDFPPGLELIESMGKGIAGIISIGIFIDGIFRVEVKAATHK